MRHRTSPSFEWPEPLSLHSPSYLGENYLWGMEPKRAVLLLSGGLDSATLLALATSEGYAIRALSCDDGQRHSAGLSAARKIASRYGVVQHLIAKIDLRVF